MTPEEGIPVAKDGRILLVGFLVLVEFSGRISAVRFDLRGEEACERDY